MMFNPKDHPYRADEHDLHVLKGCKRRPVTANQLKLIFMGNSAYIRMMKVIRERGLCGEVVVKILTRDYSLYQQKDEFVGDLFDISHNHKIVGVNNPWNLYVEETEDGMLIDANAIDAIVGRI